MTGLGTMTLHFTPGLSISALQEKCDSVFRSPRNATAIRSVYVYGVLWSLCSEFSGHPTDMAFAKRCHSLGRSFSGMLEKTVGELRLIMPATPEAAAALTMAVSTLLSDSMNIQR